MTDDARRQQALEMLAAAGIDRDAVTSTADGRLAIALKNGGLAAFGPEKGEGWTWTRYDARGDVEDQGCPENSDDLVSDLLFSLSLTD